jgi:hypothetical protein
MYRFITLTALVMLMVFMFSCSERNDFANGYVEVSYDFVAPEKMEPSFQTVIWLEKENGEYLKTFMVTEYLSMGGYEDSVVCSDWVQKVDWESVSDAEYDAITMPTPPIGTNHLKIDCEKEKIMHGKYRICIQTHIEDDYNILYYGIIDINGKKTDAAAKRKYIPDVYEGADNVLTNVSFKYINK